MSVRTTAVGGAVALLLAATVSGCGVTRGDDGNDLLMTIPNSPGGGYDLTGRAAVATMREDDVTGGKWTVENVIGAGGAVAMADLMGKAGDDHTVMTVGLGIVGSLYSFGSEYRMADATPIAQLITEVEGVFVPADSPYQTIDDFVDDWKADPSGITVGGGSSPGGPDHLFPMELAAAVGIDPNDVNFITYDGGGPLTSALLGNKIQVGFSGLGEFAGQIESGELRVLAVSGDERAPQEDLADVPTLTEEGIDVVFLNWRGVLAPPDISEERRDELVGYFEEMHASPQWQQQLEDNGWTDAFITGDEFETFLVEQDERVSGTLEELGLL
jgi:putative tricarboxylic transport membrane protein